jgi:hypothetical protein
MSASTSAFGTNRFLTGRQADGETCSWTQVFWRVRRQGPNHAHGQLLFWKSLEEDVVQEREEEVSEGDFIYTFCLYLP